MLSTKLKIVFITTMTIAFIFGFLHLFFPNYPYDFRSLHIFLYNLVAGGTILLYYTEKKDHMSAKVWSFYVLSIIYALFLFFEVYWVGIVLGLVLAGIVESIRIKYFQWFPWDFFTSKTSVAKKFHHAALLCLSIGLTLASFAVWNHAYGHVIDLETLSLRSFYLGYSFPVSLITFSVTFKTLKKPSNKFFEFMGPYTFWSINLGVIIFFVFIIFEALYLELMISLLLFLSVLLVLYMYAVLGEKQQQKAFITSGLTFLLVVSILGVTYISLKFFPGAYQKTHDVLLHYHALYALYGWGLSGLAVIVRYDDFPIKFHEKQMILYHWILIGGITPIAYYYKIPALISIPLYFVFLYVLFFSKPTHVILKNGEERDS